MTIRHGERFAGKGKQYNALMNYQMETIQNKSCLICLYYLTKPANGSMSQILNLLSNTLNPSLLESTQAELQRVRSNQGFATELLMVADSSNNDIKIRQSALIVLKNMIYDECSKSGTINKHDYEVIKASILNALARQWGNKYLTPTIRQIIYLIAERDYPDNWTDLVPTALDNIAGSSDFNVVSSSVEALKAITSVCGRSLDHEITLNNLCNKMVVPLFELANKLFANYTPETQPILTSIFKIFNLAIFYHLPNILVNNIHSLMIFCKKIVDLSIPEMLPLKVACLKILSRLYTRHAGASVGYKLLKFSLQFHERYSLAMGESFIQQLMDSNNSIEVVNLSLNCLTSIYKNHDKSAVKIDNLHQKLLEFCLLRFKMKKLKTGQSVGSFITHLKEERNFLIDFITALFSSNDKILGQLIEYLNKGDESTRELILYIFGALSEEIEDYPQLHQSMSQFIVTYILPILSGDSSTILKARGCEIISCYKYVDLPSQNLQSIFQFLYSCLIENKDSYLSIYALDGFTQLICKYDSFLALIIPYLADILKVYTGLMKESNGEVYEVIKSFELFLGHINGKDIASCAVDLVKFLEQLFHEYADQDRNRGTSNSNDENSSESGSDEQDQDENPCSARQGCLACIRQILAIQGLPASLFPTLISNSILPLSVWILLDKELLHFEECLNILNLCLYKSEHLPQGFDQFFKIFAYAIVGVPQQLGSMNLSSEYKSILMNVSVDPDEDIVSNVVGFFRNFIAKSRGELRNFKDEIGTPFLQYLFQIVERVQQSKTQEQSKYKKSDGLLVLTIYTSMLEYQFLTSSELQVIIQNLMTWCSTDSSRPASETNPYIEVLLVCLYYNAEATVDKLNVEWFVEGLLNRMSLFKYEYQLQRLLLGVTRLIDKQLLKNQSTATAVMKSLPGIVFDLISQRIKEEKEANEPYSKEQKEDIDGEEEAQEDLVAQNTHLGTFPNSQFADTDKQIEAELKACEQAEWDQEYNKFYFSPFLSLNQLELLTGVLKSSPYTALMSAEEQEKLTQYICNAPQKQAQ